MLLHSLAVTRSSLSLTDFVHLRVYEAAHPLIVERDQLGREHGTLTAALQAAQDEAA